MHHIHSITLTVLLLLGAIQATAQITRQQAQAEAQRFLFSRGKRLADSTPLKAPAQTGNHNQTAPYYVFNAANEQGFVIVSGSSHSVPILGYTNHSHFDETNIPDGLYWLLQNYADQQSPLSAPISSPAHHNIPPLLTTRWNQGSPYNLLCPKYYNEDGSQGGNSATGCVATAIAQVMGYYRWPAKLKQSISGYIQTYNTSAGTKNVRLNTIPKESVIDWGNILDNYNGFETEAQQNAIAQLMYWTGMGCKMNYGPSSGAGFPEAIKALVNCFDYDDGIHIENRSKYTIQGWHDLIYQEIASGHPVAFAGTNSGGAHAFVLDGYDADGLFHVNWGWGGMCDGYFRIDVLDPDDNSGIGASPVPGGYNMGQDAIIGFHLPDDQSASPSYCLTVNDWELRGNGTTFFANYVNWSGVSATWDVGIAYIDNHGQTIILGNTNSMQLNTNTYTSQQFTISGLPEGIWHIVPVSKRTTDDKWQMSVNPDITYILAIVDANGNITTEIHPILHLAMSSLTFPGNHKTGDEQTVCATFTNNGDEYYHEIHLFASTTDSKGTSCCRTALAVANDSETTVALRFKPTQAGTWHLWLATDDKGNHVIGEGQLEVTDEGIASTNTLRYVTHNVTNKRNNDIYGNRMEGNVTVRNQGTETFSGKLKLWLFKQADNGYYYGDQSTIATMQIEPGKTARADFSFSHLELGANYVMSILYAEGGDILDGGLKPMGTVKAGIVYWMQNMSLMPLEAAATVTTPSGAVAIDMTGLAGSINSVRPNSNKNTLYIFGEDETVPEGLEGCNIVKGNHAETIVLTDSMNFLAPQSFTAEHVSYSRQFKKNQWQTLALPFSPAEVSQNPHILTFTGNSADGEVWFDDTEKIEAGLPCLVSFDTTGLQTFSATDAIIMSSYTPMRLSSHQFEMAGSTLFTTVANSYLLNEEGNAFLPTHSNSRIAPFRAYFNTTTNAEQIPVNSKTVSISNIHNTNYTNNFFLDLQGRKVFHPQPGIYIKDGKKIVIK